MPDEFDQYKSQPSDDPFDEYKVHTIASLNKLPTKKTEGSPAPSTAQQIAGILKGRKFKDLPLKEQTQILSLGFGEQAQREAAQASGPESAGKGMVSRGYHEVLSLLDELAEGVLKPVSGLEDPKTAAIAATGVIALEIPAAVFGTQAARQIIPQIEEVEKHTTPGNVQDLLLTGSQLLLSPAAAKGEAPEKASTLPESARPGAGIVRGVLGFGPDVTEEAVKKAGEKHLEAVESTKEKQAAEDVKTEAKNREAIEKHATERRETILANEQAQAEHVAAVDEVRQENEAAQAHAMDEYRNEVRRVTDLNQTAQDQVSERGRLARDVERMSGELGEGIQQAERDARAEGNRRYAAVQEAVGARTRPSAVIVNAVRNAKDNILRTPERIGIFNDVLAKAPEEEVQTSAGATRPGEPLYEQLVAEGAIQADQPVTFKFLQGVYSKTGRLLSKGNLPGDVYQAVKSVHEAAGREMDALADEAHAGNALGDAQAYWSDMLKTFSDKDSAVATVLKRVGKLDPGYYSEPFLTGKAANRGIAALGRYNPHLARLAESMRDINRQMDALPKKATVTPEPVLPKISAKAEPEPPSPKALPGKPELKTSKQLPKPDQPEVDIRDAKMKEVDRLKRTLRGLSRYDLNRLAAIGFGGGILGFLHGGGPEALIGGALGEMIYFGGRRGLAVALDKPKVVEWLTRPQPGDVEIIRQLPDEIQNAVRVEMDDVLKKQKAHGKDIRPPREVQQFLNEKPVQDNKKKKSDRDTLLEQGSEVVGSGK